MEIFSPQNRDLRIVYAADSAEAKNAAEDIRNAISERFGFAPAVVTDLEPRAGREILVGDTNRSLSRENRSLFMDRTLQVDRASGSVALTGYLPDVTKELCNMISSGKGDAFSIFQALTGTRAAEGFGTIPQYRETGYDLMNRSDLNSYYVQYHNTTAEEYRAYLEKLETLGFTCYARREVNGNLFATYTDGYNLLSVNYAKFYQITRIASETAANVTLGRQSPDSTDKVTTPQLTQINGACAFILRLSDGRFLVIDGGLNYEKNWKSHFVNLFRTTIRLIHLIDYDNGFQTYFQCFLQYETGLRHGTFKGVYQQNTAIGEIQHTFYFTTEVTMSRSINNINFGTVVVDGNVFRKNRYTTFTFQIVVVQYKFTTILVVAEQVSRQ